MSLAIRHISRRFGAYIALEDINLEIAGGELVSLLGPSGSGKTTLLRIIAGLERSDAGAVFFNGTDATALPVNKRRVGFVFQHYALFRHMSVFKNIAFGLSILPRKERPSRTAIREKVRGLLALMQLEGMEDRYPNQLSGGQRQRVALARALATDPQVLLLDEPFGALDARVRKELRRWLRTLHQELHITTLFVTHDQDEALEVADRVVVMNQARIEQVGTPGEIYDHPATPFVHEFLGQSSALRGEVRTEGVALGRTLLSKAEALRGPRVTVYVRPHNVQLTRSENGKASLEVKVRHIHSAGSVARLELERTDTGETIEAELSRQHFDALALRIGDTLFATLHDTRIYQTPATVIRR